MEANINDISTFLRAALKNWDFKAVKRKQNDCLSSGTTFEHLRVIKESPSIRKSSDLKQRSHQKGLRKQPMPENDKISTDE